MAAINLALEHPELYGKVIADSFEGESPLEAVIQNLRAEREASKRDAAAQTFYRDMHGHGWEAVVDSDTEAVLEHAQTAGYFFHRGLESLKSDILLTGSKEDEYVKALSSNFYAKTYGAMIKKIGHGAIHLFERGGHPAALSNAEEFTALALGFFAYVP